MTSKLKTENKKLKAQAIEHEKLFVEVLNYLFQTNELKKVFIDKWNKL